MLLNGKGYGLLHKYYSITTSIPKPPEVCPLVLEPIQKERMKNGQASSDFPSALPKDISQKKYNTFWVCIILEIQNTSLPLLNSKVQRQPLVAREALKARANMKLQGLHLDCPDLQQTPPHSSGFGQLGSLFCRCEEDPACQDDVKESLRDPYGDVLLL